MLRRVGSFVALMLVATLVLAACGEPKDEVEPTVTQIPVENAPPTPTPTVEGVAPSPVAEGEAGGGETTPAETGGQTTFDIKLQDVMFDITELTVPANSEITINVTNEGALAHSFDITELNVSSGELAGGASTTLTFNSGAPGEYEYFCAVPGHKQLGMVGKLIVAGESAPPPAEGGEAASPIAPPPAASSTLEVAMEDIQFDLATLTVPANTEITIKLVNKGALSHNFSITELNVNSGEYAAGQEGEVKFNSGAPGEYQYFCDIPGHKEIGMVGKIIVQ